MKKTLICLLAIVCGLALPAWAVTGLALVHGKGSSELANLQTAIEYWTPEMIKAATNNYAYPYTIVHYDGNRYMWQAADQVAAQLCDFITKSKLDDMVVVTHSFGGTVMRWICSNPDYDSRYPTIIKKLRRVNIIAAPCKGSEAADMAGELSGSWMTAWIAEMVGQGTDATKNCTTSSMAQYNSKNLFGTAGRPALPKTFRWVSGYGLWNDMCLEDVGLATLSGIVGMPGEDDGAVSEYSAQAVGTKWFRTEANHHHNRRNNFDQIGDAIARDMATRDGDATTVLDGAMVPAETRSSTQYQAISTRYMKFVTLTPGETIREVSLPLDKSQKAYVAVWPLHQVERGADFSITLDTTATRGVKTVDQGRLELPIDANLPANGRSIVVEQAVSGDYPLHLAVSASPQKQVYGIVVNTNSELVLTAYPSKLVTFSGTPISLFAEIEESGVPVHGATVYAELCTEAGKHPSRIALTDDGQNGDVTANDGIYTVSKIVGTELAQELGTWCVRINSVGKTVSGANFERQASFSVLHAQLAGTIGKPISEIYVKSDAGKISQLVFEVPVAIEGAGRYRLMAILYSNEQPVAWTMATQTTTTLGEYVYQLTFSGKTIGATGCSGPFALHMELFSLDRIEPASEVAQGYLTAPYAADQFVAAK